MKELAPLIYILNQDSTRKEGDGLPQMPTPENGLRKLKQRWVQIQGLEQGWLFSMGHIYCKTSASTLHTVCPSICDAHHFTFLPQIPLAAGCLNTTPHSKFRALSWRLWAILPKLDRNAYKGEDFAQRNAELHHACMKVLVRDVQELSEILVPVSVEGREVNIRIILAALIDHLQQVLHLLSRNSCLYCRCPLDQMDNTTRVYDPITVEDQMRLMQEICEECLDEDGKVKPGKKTRFQEAEHKLGFRILWNAWWEVSDTFFCLRN